MKEIKWVENHIEVKPPRRTKKVTGTRFASILGLNKWSTPFEMWCAITKTYEKPFEDTIYTIAGKTIEPKQAEYLRDSYGLDLISPTDEFGEDYFHSTHGDFFHDSEHFGGMWDYLGVDESGDVDTVYEMKTTKRIEDWKNDIPEYYALQAALYAYLLGVDNVVMVTSFLSPEDYDNPDTYVPSVKNTITKSFKVSERYPDFEQKIWEVEVWWDTYVKTGISPDYDEKKDAEILAALRTNVLTPETDIKALISEAEDLKKEIDEVTASVSDKEKRLKTVSDIIKKYAIGQFNEGDDKVELKGYSYCFTVSRSERKDIDKEALKADGLYEKYMKKSESYRMNIK